MITQTRYRAFWIPGLNDDNVDRDRAIDIGVHWLRAATCAGTKLIVMNAVRMVDHLPAKAAAGIPVVSPQTRGTNYYGRPNTVLAIWPTNRSLELAEGLALNGALCVIPGTLDDLRHWILRASAENLWDRDASPEPLPELGEEVRSALDYIVSFDGHNDFLGAGGKETSIQRLRALIADGYRPDPAVLESYVLATGATSHKGAMRLRTWYEGLLVGKRFRDYGQRPL